MAEYDRIMEKRFLPSQFLNEEIRCDFTISSRQKKIWAVLIDLLIKFDEVCKKNGLKYFLMYGSLLGAVRHKGFIPWDDDLDVGMLREDYEKLFKIGEKEFNFPYFFQTPYTDKGTYYSMAKLRNSNTCCVHDSFRYAEFNQGLTLDIFPFDNCDLNEIEKNFNIIKEINIDNSSYMRKANPHLCGEEARRVDKVRDIDPLKQWEKMSSIATKYKKPTEYVICAVSTIYNWKKQVFLYQELKELIEMEFEGLLFPVPKEYEKVLTKLYGTYEEFPPLEERGIWHKGIYMDADISYKDYVLLK
ncbi:MAG: LicD family protein [Lachnospiraceae bacterium]|nr:LicD family protein [Lachnospiraceae bacterium]